MDDVEPERLCILGTCTTDGSSKQLFPWRSSVWRRRGRSRTSWKEIINWALGEENLAEGQLDLDQRHKTYLYIYKYTHMDRKRTAGTVK